MGPLLPVISAVATVASVVQGQRAASAQRRATETQMRQQEVQARASRRRSIRAAQVQRAQTLASAQGLGATGSSAVAGGISSLSSQLGTSLGFQTQMSGLSRDISTFSMQADRATGQAQLFSGIQKMTGISPREAFDEISGRLFE